MIATAMHHHVDQLTQLLPPSAGPNCIIVGAAKCGTTSLHAYLQQHPQVFMTEPKEPYFFGRDLRCAAHCSVLDPAEYARLYAPAQGQPVRGEASVWYLPSTQAAEEIHHYNPETRIIISLRQPVEMMYALHYEFLTTGDENLRDFPAAVAAAERRRAGQDLPAQARFPDCMVYADMARYAAQVKRFYDLFGPQRVHVVLFDDLKRDTLGVYRDLLRFLEIDADFTPSLEQHRKSKPMTAADLGVKRLAMRHHGLRQLLRKTPRPLVNAYYKLAPHLLPRVRPDRLLPEWQQRYLPLFTDDIAELSELLGRDLSMWTKAR